VCLERAAFDGEVAYMGSVRLGLITIANNRTLSVLGPSVEVASQVML